ncbi:hypothetical protein [Paracraurococcus ruber]|uniref:Uncharacterized protein n=1 Tax=Paracraurococcus ruber TaxID=77675 RepID=A0ABS1CZE7_9PROT|nr:hypothetical protein [Paracraurococcus ruber]MBK1659392.1 hypothetical protein [Paracraurococcus ruber]TDG30485.1 hypothetical protein E2C05_14240 [Paracraurococcus ruber]
MIRSLLLASALFAGAAQAAPEPRLVGGAGDDAHVEYGGAPMGSIVGGGTVMLQGGDLDRSFQYGPTWPQPGQVATITGGGDSQQVLRLPTRRG